MAMAKIIFINIALQLLYYIVSIYLGGFIISLINRGFYRLFGNSRAVVYGTGFIGTPIHESAHALMCLVFMHKIESIKFFQMDDENGVLGYVNHSYNRKNPYAVLGNYFIGVAPILMGCGIFCLTMWLLLPSAFAAIATGINKLFAIDASGASAATAATAGMYIGAAVKAFFMQVTTWQFWVFLLLNMCIALHMNLSGADIKGSLTALPILIGIILVVNLVLGFAWRAGYSVFVQYFNGFGMYIIAALVMSIAFSLLYLLLGLSIKGIIALLKKVKLSKLAKVAKAIK